MGCLEAMRGEGEHWGSTGVGVQGIIVRVQRDAGTPWLELWECGVPWVGVQRAVVKGVENRKGGAAHHL